MTPQESLADIACAVRENVRARLRVMVKRVLKKHGYPSDKQERATLTVLEQAEVLDWVDEVMRELNSTVSVLLSHLANGRGFEKTTGCKSAAPRFRCDLKPQRPPSRVLSFQVHQKHEPAQVKSRGSSAPSTDSSPMPQGI
jgi:hypothetical protein